jgi:hypothetical protein
MKKKSQAKSNQDQKAKASTKGARGLIGDTSGKPQARVVTCSTTSGNVTVSAKCSSGKGVAECSRRVRDVAVILDGLL